MSAEFDGLSPDTVLDAVESLGLYTTAQVQPLNSFENRVFMIGLDDAPAVIGKFYRPNRWRDEQILEEHDFTQALAEAGLPVAPALPFAGQTLHHFGGYRFSLFPRLLGRPAEFTDPDQLFELGSYLAKLHQVGTQATFSERPALTLENFFIEPSERLLTFMPASARKTIAPIFAALTPLLNDLNPGYQALPKLRVHGDCHTGNILFDQHPLFVDFDDARLAPAIQDVWMLLSGDQTEQRQQLSEIIEGYEEVTEFDRRGLAYIEFLRTLRLVQQADWRAQRWHDPAFPQAFPWFNSEQYWLDFGKQLDQQRRLLS